MKKTTQQILFGLHTVNAIIARSPQQIIRLHIQKERQDQKIQALIKVAQQQKLPINFQNKHALDQLSQQAVHQGVIAECKTIQSLNEDALIPLLDNLKEPALLLILDGVQDPHNLGACLRTADAAGAHAVIAPKDKSASLTATVCKVASGAAFTVPYIQVTNLARTMRFLTEQEIALYGAAHDAKQPLYQAKFTQDVAIILGAEGTGLRRLTQEHCDSLYNIPMHGDVSSLNVSVAGGIFLFEAVRQRLNYL